MEKTKTTKFLGSFSLNKNGGTGGTSNYNDLTNKPQVNGVTLSGNKTSADLGITTLTPFPSTWPTSGNFEDLLAVIREDATAIRGASFLGEVTFEDLPANLGNAEIKIEILEGTTSATKVIHSVITSGNRKPYRWEYTSWNNGERNSGWISFQLPLTAGTGISIENNVISTTGGTDKYGIKGDYASKYGIINAQTGLIKYSSDSKEVVVSAGLQLLMPGSETKTQIGSEIKYTINSSSDVTLFLADGEIKEAEAVYYQTEEPENGQEAYLAWFNPELGKWQFKSNDDGNVWKTPTKAGPLADVHLSDVGVIRVDYVGYRVLNDQIFALKSDFPEGNVYTDKNLISGKNIMLTPIMISGGIDSNTQACWHFDENLLDEVVGLAMPNGELTNTHKFGTKGFSFAGVSSTGKLITLNNTKSFTIDFWIYFTEANKNMTWDGNFEGYGAQSLFNVEQNRIYTAYGYNEGENTTLATPLSINTWHHVAFVHDITTKVITTYVNGSKIYSHATTYPADFNLCNFNGASPWYIDELRVSSAVEYTEDFIPATEAYSKAVATEKVAINNALTKTSQLTNDSGFITDVPVATTTVAGKMKADGTTITVTDDGTISAANSVPENMMTTNTFQEISARKDFNDSVYLNSEVRAKKITMQNGTTGIQQGTTSGSSGVQVGDYSSPVEIYTSAFNINTIHPSSGDVRSATLNGKQIATVDDITNASSGTTSVNGKSGTVVLTGADIQTTYAANPEVTESTTSDINSAFTQVCEDIHNVLTNVPTGAELMSTTVYPYQAPLATDATLADVITKVNTILAIMSERGVMKKNG